MADVGLIFYDTDSVGDPIPEATLKGFNYQPQRTNRCENYNAEPTDLTGLTLSGDVTATLTVVDDLVEIRNAGLESLCKTGKVYKGVSPTAAYVDISGALDAASTTVSLFARHDGTSTFTLRTNNVAATAQALTTDFVRYTETLTPLAGDLMRVEFTGTIYFILNQAEGGNAVTSPIITEGTVGGTTRVADDIQLPVANLTNMGDTKGEMSFDFTPGYNASDISTAHGIVTWNDTATDGVSYDGTNLSLSDGTNTATVPLTVVAGTTYSVSSRWNASTGKMQIKADGIIGAEATYDGAMNYGTNLRVGYGATERFWIKNDLITKRDPGTYT